MCCFPSCEPEMVSGDDGMDLISTHRGIRNEVERFQDQGVANNNRVLAMEPTCLGAPKVGINERL